MNYIVFDLEWNQSNNRKERDAESLIFEVIEIGAVKLNSEKQKVDEFQQLIKPTVYHELHKITEKLIHIHMEELEKGKSFVDAASDFLSWCGQDYVFCTWGPLDLLEFQRNMKYFGMEPLNDRPIAFYDVQKLFSIAFEDAKSRRSLEYAVDFLNIEKDIPFHRAFSDAYYTAKVFQAITDEKVLTRFSYDTFVLPSNKKKEIFAVFDSYAKYISREFEDKNSALMDREVMSSKCYLCHKNLRKKVKWFTPNSRNYFCVANCDKHGFMKFKVRIRKSENDKIFVVKTMKYIGKEEADSIKEKKDQTKEIRKLKRKQKQENKRSK